MSDIRAYNIKKKAMLRNVGYNINEVKKVICENSLDLVGLKIIGNDISLGSDYRYEDIETLAYDESYKLVIIEYRKDKYGGVVRKSFMAVDYIRKNTSKVKVLLANYLDKDIIANINYNARIVVFGEDFSEYDAYGIKQTPYEVDLIKTKFINDYLLIEKVYQSYKECIANKNLINNPNFKAINEFIKTLGDEVNVTGNNLFICYRKIKNFLYIVNMDPNNNQLQINIRTNRKNASCVLEENIISSSELDKLCKTIRKAYEEN